ncbi:MAG: cell separation during budding [Trizodia sp. TS-e1964]|nr:MAG: cell separation during budding [Trizodia sp. TS-e1964]
MNTYQSDNPSPVPSPPPRPVMGNASLADNWERATLEEDLPPRSPPLRLSHVPSPSIYRQSFTDNLRGLPPSPRATRQPSITPPAVQDLLDNPPATISADPAFAGRDWKTITIGELATVEDVHFVELDTPVEAAAHLLISTDAPVVLIREDCNAKVAVSTFDYTDLNAYLLLVIGLGQKGVTNTLAHHELAKKAREGVKIPVKDVLDLGYKEKLVTLTSNDTLLRAIGFFGIGVHRIAIVKQGSDEVYGVLSQLAMVKWFWENGRHFPIIDQLYPQHLKDLGTGSHNVISINGDKPLVEALELMFSEGVSSLAVVDNKMNVVGNISTVDVKHLTKSSALPLLESTCINFISVILSSRGLLDGKDSVPVFHVNPLSTIAHTVAKLVATKSHRMWIVETPSPSTSAPPTPLLANATNIAAVQRIMPAAIVEPSPQAPPSNQNIPLTPTAGMPSLAYPPISAAAIPGQHMSGHLCGVVSLTDILNLFARSTGLTAIDPNESRNQRRRSSSSSIRRSIESIRGASYDLRR